MPKAKFHRKDLRYYEQNLEGTAKIKGLNRRRLNKKVTFSEVFNVQSRQLTNCHKSNGFEPCLD